MTSRTCGQCSACCVTLPIIPPAGSAETFTKAAGVPCVNCLGNGGCAIYATRYDVCQTFECLWLTSATHMPAAMRPDQSGLIITGPGRAFPATMWGMPVLIAHETAAGAADSPSARAVLDLLMANRAIVVIKETDGSLAVRAPTDELTLKMARWMTRART